MKMIKSIDIDIFLISDTKDIYISFNNSIPNLIHNSELKDVGFFHWLSSFYIDSKKDIFENYCPISVTKYTNKDEFTHRHPKTIENQKSIYDIFYMLIPLMGDYRSIEFDSTVIANSIIYGVELSPGIISCIDGDTFKKFIDTVLYRLPLSHFFNFIEYENFSNIKKPINTRCDIILPIIKYGVDKASFNIFDIYGDSNIFTIYNKEIANKILEYGVKVKRENISNFGCDIEKLDYIPVSDSFGFLGSVYAKLILINKENYTWISKISEDIYPAHLIQYGK